MTRDGIDPGLDAPARPSLAAQSGSVAQPDAPPQPGSVEQPALAARMPDWALVMLLATGALVLAASVALVWLSAGATPTARSMYLSLGVALVAVAVDGSRSRQVPIGRTETSTASSGRGGESGRDRRSSGDNFTPLSPPNRGNRGLPPSWVQVSSALAGVSVIVVGGILPLVSDVTGSTAQIYYLSAGAFLLVYPFRPETRLLRVRTPGIRERIEAEATGPIEATSTPGIHVSGGVGGDVLINVPENEIDFATKRASESIIKQEAILREMYTQGLEQARFSFRVSLVFASVGAGILLYGVFLAVTHAASDGKQYASIVTGLTGVVINLTSGLFFIQSNKARETMAQQGALLRDESREDRKVTTARELAATISGVELRDEVRAELARRLITQAQDESQDNHSSAKSDQAKRKTKASKSNENGAREA